MQGPITASPDGYPTHGTPYAPSGAVGDFWISIPVAMLVGMTAGFGSALLIDLMRLHGGPFLKVLSGKRMSKATLVVALILIAWWLLTVIVLPLIGGWIAGRVARKAHMRSRVGLAVLAANSAVGAAFGCFLGLSAVTLAAAAIGGRPALGDSIGMIPTAASQVIANAAGAWSAWSAWDLGALGVAGLGGVLGVLLGRGWARDAMYDEGGGNWHGKAVPIGCRYFDDRPVKPLDPDHVATLVPIPPDHEVPIGTKWIELKLYPSVAESPSSELLEAVRRWEQIDSDATAKKRKAEQKKHRKRNKKLRKQGLPEEPEQQVRPEIVVAERVAMPPTYIAREAVDLRRRDGAQGA